RSSRGPGSAGGHQTTAPNRGATRATRRLLARARGEQGLERLRRRGPGEEVALAEVAAERGEHRELLVGLDALGHRRQAERVRQRDDRGGDRRVLRLAAQPGDERAVELDDVQREAPQLAERRPARAEVV